MSGKTLILSVMMLAPLGCDDRQATSDRNTPATDAPMTGGSIAPSPPTTAPATQPTEKRIDPQAIPADRAGLKDHASDQNK
jgi:hypothetical protein